jgi:uncharacterized membrane protein
MTDGLEPKVNEIGIQRVEALTDGVFAIAMTILVLDLKIPPEVREAAPDLMSALWAQSDKFVCYFWGFLLLGAFWITHVRKFRVLRGSDANHVWLNLLILIFVCLIPFSTSLLGEDSSNSVAQAVFAVNLFVVGMLYYLSWHYVSRNKRLLHESVSPERIKFITRLYLVIPIISLVALACAFLIPSLSTTVYLAIPVAFAVLKRSKARNHA